MQSKPEREALTFGFDIGIASVGWAVLAPDRIVALGVRCFDPGEDSDGKPHNQTRRAARVARNRYHMRRRRLDRLLHLFKEVGLLPDANPQLLMAPPKAPRAPNDQGPWHLRAQGLVRRLEPNEWARVLYYLVKHRGFEFFHKTEEQPPSESAAQSESHEKGEVAAKDEERKLRKGLADTTQLLEKYRTRLRHEKEEHRRNAQTIGALADWLTRESYPPGAPCPDENDRQDYLASLRNKAGDYRHAFRRADLRHELLALFSLQTEYGNPFVDNALSDDGSLLKSIPIGGASRKVEPTFREQVLAIFDMQHPPLYAEQIKEMVGECTFEKGQPRASKNAFSAERATWLEKLNNLKVRRDGPERLTPAERICLISLPYEKSSVTLKQVRDVLREKTGFPASWQEASFNLITYRPQPARDGAWLHVVAQDGTQLRLDKWASKERRKKQLPEVKKCLAAGPITFARLRELLELPEPDKFAYEINDSEVVPLAVEVTWKLPFVSEGDGLIEPGRTFKYLAPGLKARAFPKSAWKLLADLRTHSAEVTLSDWRHAMQSLAELPGGWQFEHSRRQSTLVERSAEERTQVPLKFENPQDAEDDFKFIELKGWHALRGAVAKPFPDWWQELETAWREPRSEAGLRVATAIDAVAKVLTECQTDHEIERELARLGYGRDRIEALQAINFSKFRDLGIQALRKILPFLEEGRVYSDACRLAEYNHSEKIRVTRTREIPPLKTYLYKRFRHGKPTGHTERRYKELRNPVVARAFNQARQVFNALVLRHGSPAYVHIELARDLARSKRLRKEIQDRQDANRKQRENIKSDLRKQLGGRDPSETQTLKMRLYAEQQCKCAYTGECLDPNRILDDETYAQMDHIWPRSKTFDNSLDNRVLVRSGANQNKGDRIPYNFLNGSADPIRWSRFEAWVHGCKSMSAEKRRRLLAKSLDEADEFLARNLVDTRYVTRVFANILRERVSFAGEPRAEELEAISPDDNGIIRWERYQKSRVRSPQGRLVDYLRGRWGLAHAKDREKSDLHHALDACIIAACTPKVIHRVNSYFANEEQEPRRYQFKRNSDGSYTQRMTGEVLSKTQAKERGLYLTPPWDEFHRDVLHALSNVFVSRLGKRKRKGELHGANPQGMRYLPVPLTDLTEDMLSHERLPAQITGKRRVTYDALCAVLKNHGGDARSAFGGGFSIHGKWRKPVHIAAIPLPLVSLPDAYVAQRRKLITAENKQARKDRKKPSKENFDNLVRKTIPLTNLKIKDLDEKALGSTFLIRNKNLIEALRRRLAEYGDDPKKAFASPFDPTPYGKPGPIIRSIRLPQAQGSGMFVRGGIAAIGDSIRTEVWWTGQAYVFRPRYQADAGVLFGLSEPPAGAQFLFNLQIDDPVDVTLADGRAVPGSGRPGYFVMYEGDGRMQIRTHDRPGKSPRRKKQTGEDAPLSGDRDGAASADEEEDSQGANGSQNADDITLHRFNSKEIKMLRKFKVGLLGDCVEVKSATSHGLA